MSDFRAKKSLGQNFLTSRAVIRDIVDAAGVKEGNDVLEIGPGRGALTEALLSRGARVTAIEKDERLIPVLEKRFEKEIGEGRLKLLCADIAADGVWEGLARTHRLKDGKYFVVANIPYYITGFLFRLFLEIGPQPKTLVFLVQKEVAQSAVARGGKESMFSLSLQAYGTPKLVRKVGREFFSPKPKVDSAILLLSDISRARFSSRAEERRFFEIVRAGFSAKRKTLANNLSRSLGKEKSDVEQMLASLSLPKNTRAEDVGIDDWIRLSLQLA